MDITVPPVAVGQTTENYGFCFALDTYQVLEKVQTGLSLHGVMTENDDSNIEASGEIFYQDDPTVYAPVPPSVTTVKGTWVFEMAGMKHNLTLGQPEFRDTMVGVLTLDGSGHVTNVFGNLSRGRCPQPRGDWVYTSARNRNRGFVGWVRSARSRQYLMATKETERTETDKQASEPFRVRLPGFIIQDQVGLGDIIKRATYLMGVTPCAACEKRAAWLNRSVVFTR